MATKRNDHNHAHIIIAGCSRFGVSLAVKLSSEGKTVIIFDKNDESFRKLPDNYKGLTVEADATDLDALIRAGIEKAMAVVAATDDDNTNIMIAEIASRIFNVENVFIKLHDVSKEAAFREYNINIISPALLCADEFKRILERDEREAAKCI